MTDPGVPAPRGRKLLRGLAVGCATLALVAVGSCAGLIWWLDRRGEPTATERFAGVESLGVVELTLRLEDPGTEAFVLGALARLQEERDEHMPAQTPAALRSLVHLFDRLRDRKMRQAFPVAVGLVLEPAAGGGTEPEWLAHAAFAAGGNRMRVADWMMGLALRVATKDPSTIHAGERILHLASAGEDPERVPALFLRGGEMFVASRPSVARAVVDRLGRTAPGREPTRLGRLLAEVPAGRPLRAAAINDGGELATLLGPLLARHAPGAVPGALLTTARNVTLSGSFAAASLASAWPTRSEPSPPCCRATESPATDPPFRVRQ